MADEKKAPETPQVAPAPQAAASQAQAAAPAAKPKKNKKISQMTIKEVEEKLTLSKEKMGRLDSRYASELLKRKEVLLSTKKA